MEPAREPPWAEHEKVYLLAEIIKAAPVPAQVLYSIIRDSSIQPRWTDIALPQGRSLRSCQMAFHDLATTHPGGGGGGGGDYRPRPQLPAPIMYPGPDIPKKRPHQPETSTPIGRLLQPRPPHSYPGEFVSAGPAYQMSPVGEPANKKKRGRPTKAEAQARAEQAAARGEVYPPPRKARTSVTAPEPPPGDPRPPIQTPPGAVQTTMGTATTPQQQIQPERGAESSSGKRRKTKPTPLELEKPQRVLNEMESPLAFGSTPGDQSRSQAYSTFTPISAPLPSSTEPKEKEVRMEGVEESQPRTATPRSFKDTVGI
ncbi:hypothetical protein BDV95DRAFT_479804 [Massariosphaeria phaeospora]|uniref:AT hook domain-containing protein n=1 Tax=Massariosphaeria phaeospora TaxID=100035 RepID=A0A7C8IFV6_9PLEO|nr:hypothetical protein BDV95DRAFT_479804 [Massariosphaeria phaeospora]